jgi:uncharacterized protein
MDSNSHNQKCDPLLPFFLLIFAITWGLGGFAIFLPAQFQALFGELTDTSPIYFFAVAAPTISATIFSFVQDGLGGLKRLYKRLVQWRFGVKWYALILVGIPTAGWLATWFTGSYPLKPTGSLKELLWLLLSLLISGPLGEELGWRGFALPRLLKRFTPLTASLVLGAIWGMWHLPSFFLSGMVQDRMSLLFFLLFTPSFSIFITWVFQHTGESVFSAVLIHYMVNFCASVLGVTLPVMGGLMVATSMLVVALDKQFGWSYLVKLVRPTQEIGNTYERLET